MLKRLLPILLLFCSVLLHAQTHSLVIGINNGNLIGAENDARAMVDLLQKKQINITYQLIGNSATSQNIVNSFKNIVADAKPNDWVYLFFSGHGTSPFDPAISSNKALKQTLRGTGALLSYDNQLIIVRDTLAPLFRTLDKNNVNTVVIFDACFSGMAYKDLFNQQKNFAFYTKNPTHKISYPYKNIRFFSSSTYTDFASESQQDRRGYFSKAMTYCLSYNHTNKSIKTCLDEVKYTQKQLPQTPIILPRTNFSVFPNYATKNIVIAPHATLTQKEKIFALAKNRSSFELYTQDKQGKTSKNYSQHKKLTFYLKSDYKGYFALFMMGKSSKLKLAFPNKQLRYIGDTYTRLFSAKATKSFGEENLVAFLLKKEDAKRLQKLYLRTGGELKRETDIEEAMNIIKQSQVDGSKLSLISSED